MQDQSTFGFNRQDAESILATIGGYESEIPEFMPSSGGATIKYAYPPSGGIPTGNYNSTTDRLTPGVATCTLAVVESNGVYVPGTETVQVENQVGTVVGASGKPITIAKNSYGKWTVIVEDCSAGTDSGNPDISEPAPEPEEPLP